MKQSLVLPILILLNGGLFLQAAGLVNPRSFSNPERNGNYSADFRTPKNQNQQLWILTARISRTVSSQRDTTMSFDAGGHPWVKESHSTARTVAQGQVTAIIENQAENQATEFLFISDSGEPKSMSVTGGGSHSESSSDRETIDGKVVNEGFRTDQVSGSASPGASIQFQYTDEYKSADIGIGIDARGSSSGKMFDGEWKEYGGEYDHYGISCSGGCDLSSDKHCSITKSGTGYHASWKMSESKQLHSASGTEFITEEISLEITVSQYKEPDKPVLTLMGCTVLGVGENSMVVATAKPEGGTFRFWAEPGSMLTVESEGSSAKITGASPERGALFVEYISIEGKTAQSSQTVSCVKVEKYNGGQPIPQIALYDIEGKKLPGILTVPVDAQPANASELVRFEPADPGVLTAVGVGSEVQLQGVRIGKTTLQAITKCGAKTGPTIEVEVVNCDDETIARLEKMKKAAVENLVAATKDMQQHAGSKEFEKARDDLVSSAVALLAKVGLTIISGGKTTGVVTKVVDGKEVISKAIPLAADIADKGSALSDIIGSSNLEELGANVAKPTSGEAFERIVKLKFGEATKELYGKSLGALTGLVEVGQAADRFYNNVGELYYHEELLEKFLKIMEKAEAELKVITSRQQLCKCEKTETPQKKEPKTEPKPEPTKPTPPTEKPTVQEPQTEEPVAQEAQTEEPPADDDIIGDPEPPAIPPRQVGLPYEPDDCGCSSSKNLTVNSKGFSTLGTGIKNLGECVENYKRISLTDYQKALTELSELTESLSSALQTDASTFLVKAKESKPQLDAIVLRVKSYDEAGKAFLDNMEKCPETISIGMEIFKSVETITIDSVKTNY